MKTNKKFDAAAMLAAIASGAAYNFALEGAAKKVDFVNENYMVIKSLGSALVGSGMVYFGKSNASKAAGFGLLGVAGASAASKISTMIVTSGNPMQGRNATETLKRINQVLSAKKKDQRNAIAQILMPPKNVTNARQVNWTAPAPQKAAMWGRVAFSDNIYGFN